MASDYRVRIVLDGQDNASDDVRRVKQELTGLDQGARQGASGLGMMTAGVAAFAGVWATLQIGQKVLEMRELGATSTAAANVFEALTGSTQAAAAGLGVLRSATRGVVDDTTLMVEASQMMRMGIATTADEAARYIEMAVALKRPTESAADAIQNFTLMLANDSKLRLDTYGISAAEVDRVMNRLLETGKALNKEEAFDLAVLEVGTGQMDRLNTAIEANATEWDKLSTRIENWRSTAGESIAGFGEQAAGALNDVIDNVDALNERLDALAREREVQVAIAASVTGGASGQYRQEALNQGVNPEYIDQIVAGAGMTSQQIADTLRVIATMQENGAIESGLLPQDAVRQYENIMGRSLPAELRAVVIDSLRSYQATAASGWTPPTNLVAAVTSPDYVASVLETPNDEIIRFQERQRAAWRTMAAPLTDWYGGTANDTTMTPGMRAGLSYRSGMQAMQEREARMAFEAQYGRGGVGDWYGGQLATQGQAAGNARVDELRAGAQELLGNIVTGVVDRFQGARASAERIAGALQEAHEAAARIPATLDSWLGRGKPEGIEADLYRRVAGEIEDPEAREQFMRSVGLSTWRDELPDILAGMSPAEAAMASRSLGQAFATGQEPRSMAEAMQMAGYFRAPGSGGGQQFTIEPGMTPGQIAARLGVSTEQVIAATGARDAYSVPTGTFTLGGGGGWQRIAGASGPMEQGDAGWGTSVSGATDEAQQFARNLEEAAGYAMEVQGSLESIQGMVAEATIEARLVVTGDTWAIELLNMQGTLANGGDSRNKAVGTQGSSAVTANRTTRGRGGVQAFAG